MLVGIVVLFFAGAPIDLVALGGGSLLMLGRVRPERLTSQVDWNLLVLFAGLFVVVHGFERHVVSTWNLDGAVPMASTGAVTAVTAALSNLVSNVPAVLVLKSLVTSMASSARTHAWLTLAMASTLSGNLTPIASVANLIVVEGAKPRGGRRVVPGLLHGGGAADGHHPRARGGVARVDAVRAVRTLPGRIAPRRSRRTPSPGR